MVNIIYLNDILMILYFFSISVSENRPVKKYLPSFENIILRLRKSEQETLEKLKETKPTPSNIFANILPFWPAPNRRIKMVVNSNDLDSLEAGLNKRPVPWGLRMF